MKIGLVVLFAGLLGALFGLAAASLGLPGWAAGAATGIMMPVIWKVVPDRPSRR